MATIKKEKLTKQTSRNTRERVTAELEKTFPDLKVLLGEKKFLKRIKKAAKLLSGKIKVRSAAKKTAPKKAVPAKAKVMAKKKAIAKAEG